MANHEKPETEAAPKTSSVDVDTEPMVAVQTATIDPDDPLTWPDWYTVDVPDSPIPSQIDPPDLPFGSTEPPP